MFSLILLSSRLCTLKSGLAFNSGWSRCDSLIFNLVLQRGEFFNNDKFPTKHNIEKGKSLNIICRERVEL
jgi:hypothetical protein